MMLCFVCGCKVFRVFLYSGDERTVYKCTYIMMCVIVHKPVLEYCM